MPTSTYHTYLQNGARYIVMTSRSGTWTKDLQGRRILEYLAAQPGLVLRIEASDVTNVQATKKLAASITRPLGGVMLLAIVLRDGMFAQQTKEDFDKVFYSKNLALKALMEAIDIPSLDFFIPFSSAVGLLGNGGQANYASANTTIDGVTRYWRNTFSFIVPAMIDSGGLVAELTTTSGQRLKHLTTWGMTCAGKFGTSGVTSSY